MGKIVIRYERHYERPVDVVRSHFGDIAHHARRGVHKGLAFEILSDSPAECRYLQRTRILGMAQEDEVVLRRADGKVVMDVVRGTNHGTHFDFSFFPDGAGTRLRLELTVPTSGLKALLQPLFRRALYRIVDAAAEEDRVDLEERGYAPAARQAA